MFQPFACAIGIANGLKSKTLPISTSYLFSLKAVTLTFRKGSENDVAILNWSNFDRSLLMTLSFTQDKNGTVISPAVPPVKIVSVVTSKVFVSSLKALL
jgi:hypothetical protein